MDGIHDSHKFLIFSLDKMDKTLQQLFLKDPRLNHYMTYYNVGLQPNQWITKVSDANIFDPAEPSCCELEIDERPTGNIYAPHLDFQISLHGAKKEAPFKKAQPGQWTPHVNISIEENNPENQINLHIEEEDCRYYFCPKAINTFISVGNISQRPRSKKVANQLAQLRPETLYGLKRAGDWGQVEHARRYGKIFITSDRLAALYAYFRDVPCILIRHQTFEPFNKHHPNISQYSFVLIKPNN
jgi:hypothetical protein